VDDSSVSVKLRSLACRSPGYISRNRPVAGVPGPTPYRVLTRHPSSSAGRHSSALGTSRPTGISRGTARNMRLFAAAAMPEFKAFEAGAAIDRSAPLPDLRFAVAAE